MVGPSDLGFQNVTLRLVQIEDGLHVSSSPIYAIPSYRLFKYIIVTFHFRIGSRTFDTVGVVQAVAPGHTYPLTIVGSTHSGVPNDHATVTNLDPTTLVFEVTYPGPVDHEDQ